jgi:AcrR family transcriptional regulator
MIRAVSYITYRTSRFDASEHMTKTDNTIDRGRPRNADIDVAVMKSTLKLLGRVGFRRLTLDAVAESAGVGKMAIYRRWPNKASVVMDAFLTLIGPESEFPSATRAIIRLKLQMRLQAKLFAGDYGKLIKALLGESQFDEELAEAFRNRWLIPRRKMTLDVLNVAVKQGDLRADLDLDTAIDILYGPFYYRLQLGIGTLDSKFSDRVWSAAIAGFRAAAS